MTNQHAPFSFWLCPCAEDNEYICGLINKLSKTYSAIPFLPHLTVFAVYDTPMEKDNFSFLKTSFKNFSPFSVPVLNVRYSDLFFKTCFVEVQNTEPLLTVFRILKDAFPQSPYELHPHISLLYSKMGLADKKHLAESIALEKNEIRFDKIKPKFRS